MSSKLDVNIKPICHNGIYLLFGRTTYKSEAQNISQDKADWQKSPQSIFTKYRKKRFFKAIPSCLPCTERKWITFVIWLWHILFLPSILVCCEQEITWNKYVYGHQISSDMKLNQHYSFIAELAFKHWPCNCTEYKFYHMPHNRKATNRSGHCYLIRKT
jgi:hypothetical protein